MSAREKRGHWLKKYSVFLCSGLVSAVFAVRYHIQQETLLPTPDNGSQLHCAVAQVQDGDSLLADCPGGHLRVRLWGIDAAEMGQKPWGEQARTYLQELLQAYPQVRLEITDTDRYGRSVARIWVDQQQDIGLQMVRAGKAIVYEQYNDSEHYRQVQAEAKQAALGIWAVQGGQQNPALWRRLNPR